MSSIHHGFFRYQTYYSHIFFFFLEEILILEVTIVVFSIFMKSMIFFLIQAIFIYWKKKSNEKTKKCKKMNQGTKKRVYLSLDRLAASALLRAMA